MESRISLKSVLIAVMFFAVAVTMHEAARADRGQGGYHSGLSSIQTDSDGAPAQAGTRLRANFLSLPD